MQVEVHVQVQEAEVHAQDRLARDWWFVLMYGSLRMVQDLQTAGIYNTKKFSWNPDAPHSYTVLGRGHP